MLLYLTFKISAIDFLVHYPSGHQVVTEFELLTEVDLKT